MPNLFTCIITITCNDNIVPVPLFIDAGASSVQGTFIVSPAIELVPSLAGNKYLFQLSYNCMTNEIIEDRIVYSAGRVQDAPVVLTVAWKFPGDFSKASVAVRINQKDNYSVKSKLFKLKKNKYCTLEVAITQIRQ
jgi:hypothetical protein